MRDFMFNVPTRMHFGRDCLNYLAAEVRNYGTKPLIVYGGGSVKRNGCYDDVTGKLKEAGIEWAELSGVKPNPRYESVVEGIEILKREKCDVLLPIGGASAIDCAKSIAACADYEGEPWDIMSKKVPVGHVYPVLAVQTSIGAGSEMSTSSVISRMETNEKFGYSSPAMRPKVAFDNPEYTFTMPPKMIAAGLADAYSHVMEGYFSNVPEAYLQKEFSIAMFRTLVKYSERSYRNPTDYEARSNTMWAACWAINGLAIKGNPVQWTMHKMEHELSAYYDVTHGIGLAILMPAWMKWCLTEDNAYRYVEYLHQVFEVDTEGMDKMEAAKMAIDKTVEFFRTLDLPEHLSEIGIEEKMLPVMAHEASVVGKDYLPYGFRPISEEGALEIYKLAF